MAKKVEDARDILSGTPAGAMWVSMFDVCMLLNFSEIARTYFKKDASWFNQRLHGYKVGGKPAQFKTEELDILSASLRDIAQKVLNAAEKVEAYRNS